MREFDLFEVSGPRDCLRCAVLGVKSLLERELELLRGDIARVKFTCRSCGWLLQGIVNVEGQTAVAVEPVAPVRKPAFNRPALEMPAPTPEPAAREYANEAEALRATYPDAVPEDQLRELLLSAYPPFLERDQVRAERAVQTHSTKLGDANEITEIEVSYRIGGERIDGMGTTYVCQSGVPGDLEADINRTVQAFKSALEPKAAQPVRMAKPRGAVAISAGGYNNPGSSEVAVDTRTGLLRSFGMGR